MTTQISDKVAYRGTVYHLVEARGTRLFEPSRVGLKPIARSTANWRGFRCEYLIDDGLLLLDRVRIGLREPSPLYSREPVLNALGTTWTYSNLRHHFKFSGYLRIGDDRFMKLQNRVWLHRAPQDRTLLRLEFTRGQLTHVADESTGESPAGPRAATFNAGAHESGDETTAQ